MRNTLKFKIAVAFLVVAIGTIGLALLLTEHELDDTFRQYVEDELATRDRRIVQAIANAYIPTGNWRVVERQMVHLSMVTNTRIAVADSQGNIVLETAPAQRPDPGPSASRLRSLMLVPRWWMGFLEDEFPQEETPESGDKPTQPGDTRRYDLVQGGRHVGSVTITSLGRLGTWTSRDLAFRDAVGWSMRTAGIVAICLALILGLVFSDRLTRPLSHLASAVRQIGKGNLEARVAVASSDELGDLGRAFNEMADRLQRNEHLRRKLTSDIAHELRTPLSIIQGYLEAFRDGVLPVDEQGLAMVYEEIERLRDLIDKLQELSLAEARAVQLERSPVDLGALAKDIYLRFRPRFEAADLKFECQAREGLWASIDREAIRRVLGNLLSNALKYTPPGGSVNLMVETEDPRTAVIQVADTGEGIPEGELENIFERFYRVDASRTRSTGGTGLGLTIARELAEAHGGRITVKSEVGRGTIFSVYLPLQSEPDR